jgi:hypothetical protein
MLIIISISKWSKLNAYQWSNKNMIMTIGKESETLIIDEINTNTFWHSSSIAKSPLHFAGDGFVGKIRSWTSDYLLTSIQIWWSRIKTTLNGALNSRYIEWRSKSSDVTTTGFKLTLLLRISIQWRTFLCTWTIIKQIKWHWNPIPFWISSTSLHLKKRT